jgi:hypothetical protein
MTSRAALIGCLIVAAVGSAACGGGDATGNPTDGGTSIGCSSDGQCGSGLACMANVCVPRATSIATLAIEIDPLPGSNAALTELPAADIPTAHLVLTADSSLPLTASFLASASDPATNVPASASAVLSLPSLIAGRPDLSFDTMLMSGSTTALAVPANARGRRGNVSLVPLAPADQTNPPCSFDVNVPTAGSTLITVAIPQASYTIRGVLKDSQGFGKGSFTARAFQRGVLVSTRTLTADTGNPSTTPGSFTLLLPATFAGRPITADPTTVQLTPVGTADPWITLAPITLADGVVDTNLGSITLPVYTVLNAFQVTAHGADPMQTPVQVPGASVRASTTMPGGDMRGTTIFLRDATADATGTANLALIPGPTGAPRTYALSVVPPPGSVWASTCIDSVPVEWIGTSGAPTLLRDVMLTRRPVVTGSVVAASGAPVGNVTVTATRASAATSSCLRGPLSTSVTTDARGMFTLPLDPDDYQFDYDPPSGSAAPRLTETVTVTNDMQRPVRLPAPALVEGNVVDNATTQLPYATVRMFEACPASAKSCTAPLLRVQTQTDENGHFRVVIAAPPTN